MAEYKISIRESIHPKRDVFELSRNLGLLDFLSKASNHFGKLEACQIEEFRKGKETTTDYIEISAGYKMERIVITNLLDHPCATLLKGRSLVRVVPIDTRLVMVPISSMDQSTAVIEIDLNNAEIPKHLVSPSTGY